MQGNINFTNYVEGLSPLVTGGLGFVDEEGSFVNYTLNSVFRALNSNGKVTVNPYRVS